MRALVQCGGCSWVYTYPIEVPRNELRCPNPECGTQPLGEGGQVGAILPDGDEACQKALKSVFASGGAPA